MNKKAEFKLNSLLYRKSVKRLKCWRHVVSIKSLFKVCVTSIWPPSSKIQAITFNRILQLPCLHRMHYIYTVVFSGRVEGKTQRTVYWAVWYKYVHNHIIRHLLVNYYNAVLLFRWVEPVPRGTWLHIDSVPYSSGLHLVPVTKYLFPWGTWLHLRKTSRTH